MPIILGGGGSGGIDNITLGTYGSTPNAEGASFVDPTFTLQPASASFPGGVTTGTQTFAGAKTLTGTLTTQIIDNSAQYIVSQDTTANSGVSITLTYARSQRVTLTGSPTITMPALPSASDELEIFVEFIQDGAGNRSLFFNAAPTLVWATVNGLVPPIIPTAGVSTYIMFRATSGAWTGYPLGTDYGVISGLNAPSGFVGEVSSITVLAASALVCTTATPINVTSLTLGRGDWMISGNIVFDPGGTTTISRVRSSISSTSATMATAPGEGAYHDMSLTFTTGADIAFFVGTSVKNISASTTYYLVGVIDFAVSSCVVYGSLSARRMR